MFEPCKQARGIPFGLLWKPRPLGTILGYAAELQNSPGGDILVSSMLNLISIRYCIISTGNKVPAVALKIFRHLQFPLDNFWIH